VQNSYHETGFFKEEGLEVRPFGIVVYGVHLRRRGAGILGNESEIIHISASLVVGWLLALPVLLFGLLALDLLLEGEVVDTVALKDSSFYIAVNRPLTLYNLRVGGQNLMNGLTLAQ
jgi:hypothetical protein